MKLKNDVMTHSSHLLRWALASAAVAGAAGCGSDRDVGPLDDQDEPRADRIEVRLSPDRFWYHTDQPVRLSATVEDTDGRVLGDAAVAWTVEPASAATATGEHADIPGTESFELHREGRVAFTGCVADADGAPTSLCATVAIRVDDGSPSLEISSPRPGAELDDPDGIVVRGSVTDASAARVYVVGQRVEVDDIGEFEVTIPAEAGVNHLDVIASDGLTPESSVEMDVLWAPAYQAANAGGDEPLEFADGVAVSLGQRLFDGERDSAPDEAEDVASLIALIASHLPVGDLIPDPVVDEPTFQLRIPDASIGPADVSIAVTGQGLDLFIRFPELALTTAGFLQIDDKVLDLDGVVTASVAASAGVVIGGGGGEPVSIEVVDPFVAVESAQGEFVSEETAAIFRLAESVFRTVIEEQLESSVGEIAQETLPSLLGDALSLLDGALGDREIELDVDLLPAPIALSFGGELGALRATSGIDVSAALATRLGVASEIIHPDTRGVALFSPELEPPRFASEGDLQLGVRLSLVNGILHGLWSAGLLEIDLRALLPDSLGDLIQGGWVSGQMPPIARAPRAEEEGAVVLSLGQIEIELDLGDDGDAKFGASFEAALDLEVDGDRVSIANPGDLKLRVWTIEPAPGTVFTADLVEATLRSQWDDLRDALLGPLGVDLPALEIGEALAELAPDLADLTLAIEIDEPLRLRGDFLVIGASVRGGLPALARPLLARLAGN